MLNEVKYLGKKTNDLKKQLDFLPKSSPKGVFRDPRCARQADNGRVI